MKNFLRILSHLKSYKGRIGLNLFYNLLNALFSVVSFSAIIPFLKILFDTTNDTAEKSTDDGLENSLLATLNNWFDSFIAENGARQALFIFCMVVDTSKDIQIWTSWSHCCRSSRGRQFVSAWGIIRKFIFLLPIHNL